MHPGEQGPGRQLGLEQTGERDQPRLDRAQTGEPDQPRLDRPTASHVQVGAREEVVAASGALGRAANRSIVDRLRSADQYPVRTAAATSGAGKSSTVVSVPRMTASRTQSATAPE